jgi:uncharacterized protein YjbJ (UPF0337 family)
MDKEHPKDAMTNAVGKTKEAVGHVVGGKVDQAIKQR